MITIDRTHSALLVMDYQTPIVGAVGDAAAGLLARAKTLTATARSLNVPVIYVVVGFRPGYPEVSPYNASFSASALVSRGGFVGVPGADIPAAIAPAPGDLVVVKRRVSAFSGSDLATILRAKGIDTLILMGISTSGVVLSTLREAADADYRLVVVSDGCADRDDEVHRVLLEKVFPRQATVATASEVDAALAATAT